MARCLAAVLALVIIAPVSSQAAEFSGPFAGVHAGPGERTFDTSQIDKNTHGIDYGAFAGFDLGTGGIVLGVEGGVGKGGKAATRTFTNGAVTRISPGLSYSATARAGAMLTPRLLAYARLGYARERIRTTFSNSTPSLFKDTADGALYGGGLEYGLSRLISVRAEYRYSAFGNGYNPRQVLIGAALRL